MSILRLWAGVLGGLAALAAGGAAQQTNLPASRLNVLLAGSLLPNSNINDVKAAFKIWIGALGRLRGFALSTETEVYHNREEVETQVRDKFADLVILTTLDYLSFPDRGSLNPVFSASRRPDSHFDEYVLLARTDRRGTGLEALRGGNILIYRYGCELGPRWLDVSLAENRLGPAAGFFGSLQYVTKVSAAVLPVFFGKGDACLVDRSGWETMKELNPQLGEKLEVLLQSPAFSESVVCLRTGYEGFREEVLAGLSELQNEPDGKQILSLFKIDRLVLFKPEYLDSVRDLQSRLAKAGNASPRAGGPGPVIRQNQQRNWL